MACMHLDGVEACVLRGLSALEDGQFAADCYHDLKDLNAELHEHARQNGGKAKGKLTITIDIVQDGGVTELKSTFKIARPEARRAKSVLWQTEDHRFTRTRPGQQQLFGIRDADAPAGRFRDAS